MYFLGVDGGGTKTAYRLSDEEFNIISEYRGDTTNYQQCGFDGLTREIKNGVSKVLKLAGVKKEEVGFAFLGCGGYGDVVSDMEPARRAVEEAMDGIPFRLGNDIENAHAGALNGEDGINIIAGTGSIACGVSSAHKEMLRCGGWHHYIGSDEGSGYWIAQRMLHEFTRQSDGRDEKTELYQAIKDALQIGEDDGEIIKRVVDDWQFDRTKIASICPLIAELFDRGDPSAKMILDDAASELSELAVTLRRQLLFDDDETVKVSGTGGVFNMGDRIIKPLSEKLSRHNMQFVPPVYEPDMGALILAKKLYKEK